MRTRNESRHRPNRSGWLVTQRLEDWMEMHKAQPVACLALVELADGDREIRAMSLTNGEIFEEQPGAVLFFE